MVPVDSTAYERNEIARISCGAVSKVFEKLGFAECPGNVEHPPQTQLLGNTGEEFFDRIDTDCRQHLLPVGLGTRDISHCLFVTAGESLRADRDFTLLSYSLRIVWQTSASTFRSYC